MSAVVHRARSPARSQAAGQSADALLAGMAALALGLILDRSFGLLPALSARCGGSGAVWQTLEWHFACMPATFLTMAFAAPVCFGLRALATTGRGRVSRRRLGAGALAELSRHLAMLAGMACFLVISPSVVALAGAPWTNGVAISAMVFGMAAGVAASWMVGELCAASEPAPTAVVSETG